MRMRPPQLAALVIRPIEKGRLPALRITRRAAHLHGAEERAGGESEQAIGRHSRIRRVGID
jgi:hypothetical protein